MGLNEHLLAGAQLKRNLTQLTTDVVGSGSLNLNSVYTLLSIGTNSPCRLRLYDNATSVSASSEISRPFGDVSIDSSIALIGDFSMSQAGSYPVDPVMIGFSEVNVPSLTYYRIEPAQVAELTFNTYTMEDNAIIASPGSFYSVENRRTLVEITGSLGPLASGSASLSNIEIPTTYYLVSASLSGSDTQARIRLYNTSSAILDIDEQSRPFETEPTGSAASYLLADIFLSSSNILYFTPKILGSNLENLDVESLENMKGDITKLSGENELYYTIENTATSGGTVDISASLHVFALED